jgi:hypothetical protein
MSMEQAHATDAAIQAALPGTSIRYLRGDDGGHAWDGKKMARIPSGYATITASVKDPRAGNTMVATLAAGESVSSLIGRLRAETSARAKATQRRIATERDIARS